MKQIRPYYRLRVFLQSITLVFLSISIVSCTSTEDKLVIATAANAQFTLQEIVDSFTQETGFLAELVISSSGKHTAQIFAGAPYDVFVSADMKYPEKLYQGNLTTAPPKAYAFGQLVLWSLDSSMLKPIEKLPNYEFKHIALPNPETAPYGTAAQEALQNLNLWDSLEPHFVYGESVAQANQYIISGAAAIGFTASSIVMAPANQGKGAWLSVPDTLYSPIAQGVVVLKNSENRDLAEKFYNYLLSHKSQDILRSYGYTTKFE